MHRDGYGGATALARRCVSDLLSKAVGLQDHQADAMPVGRQALLHSHELFKISPTSVSWIRRFLRSYINLLVSDPWHLPPWRCGSSANVRLDRNIYFCRGLSLTSSFHLLLTLLLALWALHTILTYRLQSLTFTCQVRRAQDRDNRTTCSTTFSQKVLQGIF